VADDILGELELLLIWRSTDDDGDKLGGLPNGESIVSFNIAEQDKVLASM
jgi:hypothetical protein